MIDTPPWSFAASDYRKVPKLVRWWAHPTQDTVRVNWTDSDGELCHTVVELVEYDDGTITVKHLVGVDLDRTLWGEVIDAHRGNAHLHRKVGAFVLLKCPCCRSLLPVDWDSDREQRQCLECESTLVVRRGIEGLEVSQRAA